ncbi:MAG: hypothetical protein VX335_02080 [Pseudomonadota bacterium]|nr:hypothetical protein [Pseudomonadota bacterium]
MNNQTEIKPNYRYVISYILSTAGVIGGGIVAGIPITLLAVAILLAAIILIGTVGFAVPTITVGLILPIIAITIAMGLLAVALGCAADLIMMALVFAAAVAAFAIGLSLLGIALSIIPVIYMTTNIIVLNIFSSSIITLGANNLTLPIIGIMGASLLIANLIIDCIINGNLDIRASDSFIASIVSSLVTFALISVPIFFICGACGLPLFSPTLLTGNINLISAIIPTNALNISFLVTATVAKIPLTTATAITFTSTDQQIINHIKALELKDEIKSTNSEEKAAENQDPGLQSLVSPS